MGHSTDNSTGGAEGNHEVVREKDEKHLDAVEPTTDVPAYDPDLAEVDTSLQAGELTLEEDTAGGMGRHLGVFSSTLLSIGKMIGTGIFSTPSSITSSTGSVGAAMMMWLLGFVISIAGLFVWLEFASMFPRSGGEKVYLEASFRYPKSFATVVYAIYAVVLGFTATGAISFASYMFNAAGRTATAWEARGVAIAVALWVCLLHAFAPRTGVKIMNIIGSIKVFVLLFIIVAGWAVLGGAVSKDKIPDPQASFKNAFAGSTSESNPYATALYKVLFSFAGYQNAAYVLNEIHSPVRTLKISSTIALTFVGIMYMLANVSYYAAGTQKEIAASGITVGAFFFGKVFNEKAEKAFSVFIALSALGNVLTSTFTAARVNQEIAKEGVIPFPKFWASTWPTGAPTAGLLLHFIPTFIVLIVIPAGDAYNFIVDIESYAGSIVFFFVAIGLLWLRYKKPNVHRPFKIWISFALFFLIGQSFLLVAPFLRPPGGKGDTSIVYWGYPLVGIATTIFGAIYWVFWKKLFPKWFNYRLEEEKLVLSDGTYVTRFFKVKGA